MAAKVPLASRQHALNLYRQLLSLSKRLPSGQQREDAVRGVRESFRSNAGVTDPSKASAEMIICAYTRHQYACTALDCTAQLTHNTRAAQSPDSLAAASHLQLHYVSVFIWGTPLAENAMEIFERRIMRSLLLLKWPRFPIHLWSCTES